MPNPDYFKPIILKLKTFIYNSNNKIIHNFCICGGNTSSRCGEVHQHQHQHQNGGHLFISDSSNADLEETLYIYRAEKKWLKML